MTLRRIVPVAALASMLAGSGCLTDAGIAPAAITRVDATDGQQVPGGSRLPLRVTVLAEDGRAVARGQVRWSILTQPGRGRLSYSVTVSDGSGQAEVEITLGRVVGATTVRAVLVADPTQNVDFIVTATRTPLLNGVSPNSFEAARPMSE